jgi:hypothetical protein
MVRYQTYLYFTLGRENPDPPSEPKDGILRHQFNNRLESFAQCYSQCLPQAYFKENHRYFPLVLKILTKNYAKQENSGLFMNSI